MHLVRKFEGLSPDQWGETNQRCWAEVPLAEFNNDRARQKNLVLVVHRKCGAHNINSHCIQDDRDHPGVKVCGKNYPQPFRDTVTINSNTGRVEYRRRDTGENFPNKHRVNGKCVKAFATNRDNRSLHYRTAVWTFGQHHMLYLYCISIISLKGWIL